MNELISKLTSYNLFNYLFPGTVFVALAEAPTDYSFVQDDILLAFFLYYFIGLVISRIGSLVVEPVLRRVKFLDLAPYEDFVRRSREDPKLETLSEANNTYRTLVAMFAALGFLHAGSGLVARFDLGAGAVRVTLGALLGLLFLFSYRKQTAYVKNRVNVQ